MIYEQLVTWLLTQIIMQRKYELYPNGIHSAINGICDTSQDDTVSLIISIVAEKDVS
jgi:hypothetical protein